MDRSATLDAPFAHGRAGDVREGTVDREGALDRFLAGVERRALRMARMALRDGTEAEDAVQDAMIRLMRSYGRRPEDEWRPLFYRILRNRITDFQRRGRIRRAVTAIWSGGADKERDAYRRFMNLTPEQRDRLRERWEQMSPEERRRAIQRRQGSRPGTVDRRPCPPC